MSRQADREADSLETDLAEGRISRKEFSDAMREIAEDEREGARQAAAEAYDAYLDRW